MCYPHHCCDELEVHVRDVHSAHCLRQGHLHVVIMLAIQYILYMALEALLDLGLLRVQYQASSKIPVQKDCAG